MEVFQDLYEISGKTRVNEKINHLFRLAKLLDRISYVYLSSSLAEVLFVISYRGMTT